MLQKLRRPVAVLPVFIMLVSLFSAAPVTANAGTAELEIPDRTKHYEVLNGSYYAKEHIGENVSVNPTSIKVEGDENGWYLESDGEASVIDATLIQRYSVGISVSYPINKYV